MELCPNEQWEGGREGGLLETKKKVHTLTLALALAFEMTEEGQGRGKEGHRVSFSGHHDSV